MDLLHLFAPLRASASYYVTGSMAQPTITASPHIVANVLYPPLCLAGQGRLMCLGHGHNLVRRICSPLRHGLFDQANVTYFLGGNDSFRDPLLSLEIVNKTQPILFRAVYQFPHWGVMLSLVFLRPLSAFQSFSLFWPKLTLPVLDLPAYLVRLSQSALS